MRGTTLVHDNVMHSMFDKGNTQKPVCWRVHYDLVSFSPTMRSLQL